MSEEFNKWFDSNCQLDDPHEINIARQGWDACKYEILKLIEQYRVNGDICDYLDIGSHSKFLKELDEL